MAVRELIRSASGSGFDVESAEEVSGSKAVVQVCGEVVGVCKEAVRESGVRCSTGKEWRGLFRSREVWASVFVDWWDATVGFCCWVSKGVSPVSR